MTSKSVISLLLVLCVTAALAQNPKPAAAPSPQQPAVASPGALPDAPYVPLTKRQKFSGFARQTYAPFTFLAAAASAGYSQMTGEPYEYGGGAEGYGRRFGDAMAAAEVSRFFNRFMFPVMFRQDPRYFAAKADSGVARRGWYSAMRVLVTRGDSGKSQFNFSQFIGTGFSAAIQNAWLPESQRTWDKTMIRFGSGLGTAVASNFGLEFGPDILRIVSRHQRNKTRKPQAKAVVSQEKLAGQ